MSLDGFLVGPEDGVDAPRGDGGFPLFEWLNHRLDPGSNGQVLAEANGTRVVIAGRRTYERAGRWQGLARITGEQMGPNQPTESTPRNPYTPRPAPGYYYAAPMPMPMPMPPATPPARPTWLGRWGSA
jgi:hypothetical protein